jgi:prepilin-type N-terminal cleavage/methylation domain-containing protein
MSRAARGLTLIEVLAVIAILVVVTAVAAPEIRSRLGDASLDAAAGQLDATLIQARAQAQRRGVALRLVARRLRDGTAIATRPLVEETEESAAPGKEPAEPPLDVLWTVAAGIEVTDRDPGAKQTGSDGAKATPAEAVGEDLVLATFLPDGSAIAAGRVFLVRGQSAYALSINQWTGGATMTRLQVKPEGEGEPVEGAQAR